MPHTPTDLSLPHPTELPPDVVLVGVDTHKAAHVAVAITGLGARLAACRAPADREGYAALLAWAQGLGPVEAFAVEGTGSYGAGLASFLRRHAVRVVEVSGVDRRKRHRDGKDDTLDAEIAARALLAGTATAVPKTADGLAEMVRQLKIESLPKRDVLRCLKRFVAREVYHALLADHRARQPAPPPVLLAAA